jgi:hypothetical protein
VLRLKQTRTSKLESPWEGPYLVHEAIPGGVYRLRDPKTGVVSKTHGTHSSCVDSILRTGILPPPFFPSVIKRWQQTMLNHCALGAKQ